MHKFILLALHGLRNSDDPSRSNVRGIESPALNQLKLLIRQRARPLVSLIYLMPGVFIKFYKKDH